MVADACHCCLLSRLQPATPAPTSGPLVVRACHKDACPGVYFLPPGLLQLTAVRHQRRTTTSLLSQCRMLQRAWSQALVGVTTSHHCCDKLHGLPVRQRVNFKVAGLAHQSLAGVAPSYLADDCQLMSDVGQRTFRSSSNDIRTLIVPQTHNKFRNRSFAAAGRQL